MTSQIKVAVLGSTGSIGVNTLDVISRQTNKYCVYALSADKNIEKLISQCIKHNPHYVVVNEPKAANQLRVQLLDINSKTQVLQGEKDLSRIAASDEVDIVMAGIVGAAGLSSTYSAIKAGKKVLIANKEPIVMTGELMIEMARESGAQILPVDSEHNAIMQCLPTFFNVVGNRIVEGINRIMLTGSGGPFRTMPFERFNSITPVQACAHPNWKMGPKISIDSATMMNKALELIEACVLFGIDQSKIDIVIHPQSIIHSMVEYKDGSILAQMGCADMRIPIASALAWPQRIESGVDMLDFMKLPALEFEQPDIIRYPCLRLAREVIKQGGTAPCIMNAANEVAVNAFMQTKLKFTQICELVEKTLDQSDVDDNVDLESVLQADRFSRTIALELLNSFSA